jgi:hypothetical protein
MSQVAILGYGEVGSSLATFFDEPCVDDPDLERSIPKGTIVDTMHVCIPYSDKFFDLVCGVIVGFNVDLVVVHSTVPVGTTKKLVEELGPRIVHSPIRGKHPDLSKELAIFEKAIGADDVDVGLEVKEHLEDVGIPCRVIIGSKTTELAKLLDTTYYGVCIAYHQFAFELCEKEGVDFNDVMSYYNATYNEGMLKTGNKHFVRPVLHPPKGPIGGHCVVPNARLLEEQYGKHPLLENIK